MPSTFQKRPRLVYALLALIAAYGIYIRFQLPSPPFSDRDTWGFLFPSLNHLTTGVFCHIQGREFPYPFFIDRALALSGTLNTLSVWQHLLGVLTAALLWFAWQGMIRFFPDSPSLRASHRWIGVAIVACYLLSVGPLKMEHTIRPEAIFPVVAAAALLCGTRFSIAFYLEHQMRPAFFWGVGLVAFAFSLLFIKGAFGLGALAAIAPVLGACFRSRTPWRFRVAILAVPLALVGLFLWYPEHRLVARFDPLGNTFAQQHLFAFQGNVIREEIGDELAGRHPMAYDREVLENVARRIDRVLQTPSNHFPHLGFDADAILYAPDSTAHYLTAYFNDSRALGQFYMHYYAEAWRYHPVAMLKKIARQVLVFYWWKSPFDNQKDPISVSYEASHGLEKMPALAKPLPLFERYVAREQRLEKSPRQWHQPYPILLLNKGFAMFYRLCAIGALAAVGYLFWKSASSAHRSSDRPLWWFLYVMSYGFFNTLTLAIGHTLEVRRYVQMQLTFSLLAVGCGLLLLHLLLQHAAETVRPRESPAHPQ